MKSLWILTTATLAFTTATTAQIVAFSGRTQNTDLTENGWINSSLMWGAVESSVSNATSTDGFASLAGVADLELFQWTFGDLELTEFQIPGAASPGYEIYTDGDNSLTGFQFAYDGEIWASGEVLGLRVDVKNNSDVDAVGLAYVKLVTPGDDTAFFDEVMAYTGNGGILEFTIDEFFPVNAEGLFETTGSFTVYSAVPEPGAYGLLAGLAGLGVVMSRRTFFAARPA